MGSTIKVEARFLRYSRRNWPLDTESCGTNIQSTLVFNTFILGMCHAKFTRSNTQRELENWARKEKEKRIRTLLHLHQNDEELAKESSYYKQRNLLWKIGELKHMFSISTLLKSVNSDEKRNKMEAEIIRVFIDEVKQILSEGENTLMECNLNIDRIIPSGGNVPLHESELYTFYSGALKECRKVVDLIKTELSSSESILSTLDITRQPSLKGHVKSLTQKCWKRKENGIKKLAAKKKMKVLEDDEITVPEVPKDGTVEITEEEITCVNEEETTCVDQVLEADLEISGNLSDDDIVSENES